MIQAEEKVSVQIQYLKATLQKNKPEVACDKQTLLISNLWNMKNELWKMFTHTHKLHLGELKIDLLFK